MFLNKRVGGSKNLKMKNKANGNADDEVHMLCSPEKDLLEIEVEELKYDLDLGLERQNLNEKLCAWYCKYRPSLESVDELLCILKAEDLDVSLNCEDLRKQCGPEFNTLQETDSVRSLQRTIDEMTATNVRQYKKIMDALATQKSMMEQLLGRDEIVKKMKKFFPLQTTDDIVETDARINDSNREFYRHYMTTVLKGQLHKTLTQIFSEDLIIAINVSGIHGKLSLRKFTNLFNVLLEAIRKNGEIDPEKAVRTSLKLIKKRHFQSISMNKKKEVHVKNEPEEFICGE